MPTEPTKQSQGSISKSRRVASARVHEISIVNDFKHGYRNREDITNLPAGVLVVGSQNVLINTASRVQMREGYTMDGAKSTVNATIKSSFEWFSKGNGPRFMRGGFLTSAGNDGKLQFRYDNGTTITWTDLLTSLTSVSYNFATLWDTTELVRLLLMVDGSSNIREWNGAYDTVVSTTPNTITMTNDIGTSGFYSTRNKIITINSIDYTYTAIAGSTFTGVTPDPTGNVNAGDLAFQKVITHANAGGNDLPVTFPNDLISSLNNQVYVGSLTRPDVYVSKIGSYVDYSFSTPRLPGEGALAHLDGNIVAFTTQEDVMYISAGRDFWYNTQLVQSSSYNGSGALIVESFNVKLLKSNTLEGAQSQAFVNNMGNNVIMVQNEPAFEMLGRVDNILQTPQTTNLSDSIKNDFDTYDFTGGSCYSWRRYLLIALPAEGMVRIYNLTTKAWEAPQILPITSFYTVDGELYGHSATTSESYHLFTGYSDRATATTVGNPIQAIANFSFQNYGTRTALKNGNEFYIEGYINANTLLNCEINYELDGCQTTQTFSVDGSDNRIVCIPLDVSSFGKSSFGKIKLGGDLPDNLTGLPPKFRVIKTFPRIDFYEHQFSFSILGKDQRFELLAFGTNSAPADATNSYIKQ